jgi:uncharacterized protein (DUF736 family)
MPVIGYVTKQASGGYKGQLKTPSIRAEIEIVPNTSKDPASNQPDFRAFAKGYDIGAGWRRMSENSGMNYVSLSLAAPEFGPRKLYANLGRASRPRRPRHVRRHLEPRRLTGLALALWRGSRPSAPGPVTRRDAADKAAREQRPRSGETSDGPPPA